MAEIDPMDVSVIIPTYNRAQVLGRAIDSVLRQQDCNLQIIVVDDGSTDDTKEVVSCYGDSILYIYQDNGGAARARNVGIRHASNDCIAFLDSDDYFINSYSLHRQAKFLKEHHDYGLIYGGIKIFDDKSLNRLFVTKALSTNIYPRLLLLKYNIIFTPAVMIKKACIDTVGNFDESFILCEDIDLWRRIAKKYKVFQFNETVTAVHLRSDEKYDLKKALYWRKKLYAKAFREDAGMSALFKFQLFFELYFLLPAARLKIAVAASVKSLIIKLVGPSLSGRGERRN